MPKADTLQAAGLCADFHDFRRFGKQTLTFYYDLTLAKIAPEFHRDK